MKLAQYFLMYFLINNTYACVIVGATHVVFNVSNNEAEVSIKKLDKSTHYLIQS
jgi:P pilus assembly chaperone PapD